MAEDPTGSPHRVVRLTPLAQRDQAASYAYTAEQWGEEQAEEYILFLNAILQRLADYPALAPFAPERPGMRYHLARWKRSR